MNTLQDSLIELIRRTSAEIPDDVHQAILDSLEREKKGTLAESVVRVLPKDSNQRQTIPYAEIAALVFSGRDTAAGKSYEAWIRKYWEKRAAGEKYDLAPDTRE